MSSKVNGTFQSPEGFDPLMMEADAFSGGLIPSLEKLTPHEIRRLGNPAFITPYVPKDRYSNDAALRFVTDWLNKDPRRYERLDKEWSRVQWHFRELLDWHCNVVNKAKKNRPAKLLFFLLNIWGAGRLSLLKRCLYCDRFFAADRNNRLFHSNACRIAYHHEVTSKSTEYKARKAQEQRMRRVKAKADPSYPGSEQISKSKMSKRRT